VSVKHTEIQCLHQQHEQNEACPDPHHQYFSPTASPSACLTVAGVIKPRFEAYEKNANVSSSGASITVLARSS
jgi:hypothetical protein